MRALICVNDLPREESSMSSCRSKRLAQLEPPVLRPTLPPRSSVLPPLIAPVPLPEASSDRPCELVRIELVAWLESPVLPPVLLP